MAAKTYEARSTVHVAERHAALFEQVCAPLVAGKLPHRVAFSVRRVGERSFLRGRIRKVVYEIHVIGSAVGVAAVTKFLRERGF